MGEAAESRNTAHQTKKLSDGIVRMMRDKLGVPISDEALKGEIPFYKPADDSPEIAYLKAAARSPRRLSAASPDEGGRESASAALVGVQGSA